MCPSTLLDILCTNKFHMELWFRYTTGCDIAYISLDYKDIRNFDSIDKKFPNEFCGSTYLIECHFGELLAHHFTYWHIFPMQEIKIKIIIEHPIIKNIQNKLIKAIVQFSSAFLYIMKSSLSITNVRWFKKQSIFFSVEETA